MYPSLESHNHPPQSIQLLLHCNCGMYQPFYHSIYRPPFMPPYIPQPLPRPYHLQHYQYTQFVSPFNVPNSNPAAVIPSQTVQQNTNNQVTSTPLDLPFGPPPRDRRVLDRQENQEEEIESITSLRKNVGTARVDNLPMTLSQPLQNLTGGIDMSNLALLKNSLDMYDLQRTENFTNMLELGCSLAESIAVRNQHRPCFKNIQNLCSRTRGEILKPNTTHANIHSQGIPWATKDFIYAFVRAVNCWYILNGYMGEIDPKLGKIEKEISPEFRECYQNWETHTKKLTRHLIKVFSSLDSIVSNLSTFSQNQSTNVVLNKTIGSRMLQRKPGGGDEIEESATSSGFYLAKRSSSNTNLSFIKGMRGVLQIPESSSDTRLQVSESTTEVSLKNDDSEDEIRTYMKPGSYKTPKKKSFSESVANSPRSIEFFERAQNVPAHYRRVTTDRSDSQNSEGDKAWRSAKDTAPNFVKRKEIVSIPSEMSSVDDQLETLFDISSQRETTEIENWISDSPFNCETSHEKDYVNVNGKSFSSKQVTVLQRPKVIEEKMGENVKPYPVGDVIAASLKRSLLLKGNGTGDIQSRTYNRKRDGIDTKGFVSGGFLTSKSCSSYRKSFGGNYWEHRNGGLTDSAIEALQNIVKAMEMTELSLTMKDSPQAEEKVMSN
ncbi:uncharacterized protein LOC108736672 isoform X2 [Agrilus planipennis]|uniref:Uncharacterized protein LOC108736672 isoform X2 n=1 Tax=Agrilus planipennis TaxID=224129 RepID=A0A1W4WW13_AGRPL|nr:uncharacterized protein LOC108736672 isoform X2 [Agrilus planipennis]